MQSRLSKETPKSHYWIEIETLEGGYFKGYLFEERYQEDWGSKISLDRNEVIDYLMEKYVPLNGLTVSVHDLSSPI